MNITYNALNVEHIEAIRAGGPDAYGAPAERFVYDAPGKPCRSCLDDVPVGEEALLYALRPFPAPQPYAETGPVFLCADCDARAPSAEQPPSVASREAFLVKGYGDDDRIVYGTGRVTPTSEIDAYCETLLTRDDIAYVDLRSAVNNCFICRVTAG